MNALRMFGMLVAGLNRPFHLYGVVVGLEIGFSGAGREGAQVNVCLLRQLNQPGDPTALYNNCSDVTGVQSCHIHENLALGSDGSNESSYMHYFFLF